MNTRWEQFRKTGLNDKSFLEFGTIICNENQPYSKCKGNWIGGFKFSCGASNRDELKLDDEQENSFFLVTVWKRLEAVMEVKR